MDMKEEETATGSPSAGSAHLNTELPQPNMPHLSSINSTSVECVTNRDSASFITGDTSVAPIEIPTDHVLTTVDKIIPTTTVSAVGTTSTVLNTTNTTDTYFQATEDSARGRTPTTHTDTILANTDTTMMTTGTTSPTTNSVNIKAVTPTSSTIQPTSSILKTTSDVVLPLTNEASDPTSEMADLTGTTLVTDTTLTMEGIAQTDTVSTVTCTASPTAVSLQNAMDTGVITSEIVTPTPSKATINTKKFTPIPSVAGVNTEKVTFTPPTAVLNIEIVTTIPSQAVVNTEKVTTTPSTAAVNTEVVTPAPSAFPDTTPNSKITNVMPSLTNKNATTDTAMTMKGTGLTTTDAVLAQTAGSITTAKAAVDPPVTGAPSTTIHKSLGATNVSPSSLSNSNSPQIVGAAVERDDATGCSPSLQSSSQRKENVLASSALSLLTSYGISDSDEDCDSDNMDTSCDNTKTEEVLVNGTLENVTSHEPPEPQGDTTMKPICEFSSLSSDQSNHPSLVNQTLSNGVVVDESRCDTPDLDIIVSGSYRYTIDVGSGTDDSEDDSESSSSECESSSAKSQASSSATAEVEVLPQTEKVVVQKKRRTKRDLLLTPGELLIEDLPPIEDLHISVPEEQVRPIGTIFSIVEQQVVVEAFPNIPAIDLDSVLFLDHGNRALGQIFDVFGPVQQPFYVVRFNSAEHVRGYKIDPGDLVYFAPSTEHTNFIVIDELMKLKGSDASGLTGNELMPYESQDFSDDEEEARALRGPKQTKYTSSTNEFQPQKKRGRGQVHTRGRGRGHSETVGENGDNNPFRGRGMVPRGHHRFGHPTMMQPRFGPRGPPPFPLGPPECMHGPPIRPPPPFIQGSPRMPQNPGSYEPRPFSHFQNQMEMAGGQEMAMIPPVDERYHDGPPPNTGGWPQPPPLQFGGPPQFTIPRGCIPSPDVASPPGIPSHSHTPSPSPTGNSFQHRDPPGPFSEMMHSHPPASPGVEPVRAGERGWFPQQLAESHMLPPPDQYPPPPLHNIPPPPPPHSMPPPTAYSMPPPFPSRNMPPPHVAPNMPTLPPASHPPPPPPQVPFDPTQLPPPLPPATYFG